MPLHVLVCGPAQGAGGPEHRWSRARKTRMVSALEDGHLGRLTQTSDDSTLRQALGRESANLLHLVTS